MKDMALTTLIVVLFLPILTGCSTTPLRNDIQLPEYAIASASDLQTFVYEHAVSIDTLKASGTITIHESNGESMSYPVVVMFKQPNNFYLRAYQQLMPTIFSIVSSEGNFWLYIPAENTIFTGKNASLNYNPDYDVSITPDFLLQALFTRALASASAVNMVEAQDQYTLFLVKEQNNLKMLTRILWIDKTSLYCTRELHYSPKGFILFEIKRSNFTFDTYKKIPIARTISIRNVITGIAVTLDFKKIRINEKIKDRTFEFHYPEGVIVEEVE